MRLALGDVVQRGFDQSGAAALSGVSLFAGIATVALFSTLAACVPQGSCDHLAPGNYTCTLQHDGLSRRYIVFVPESYTGNEPVPLVVDSHGFSSPALGQRVISGMDKKAREVGFIVAWPEGSGDLYSFNGAGCCDLYHTNVDDVGFYRDMVAQLQGAANIDAARIYATGESNGGAMTHRLGCEAADIFAAVAPVAFALFEDFPCTPSRPISTFTVQAVEDQLVPFEGGTLGGNLPSWMTELLKGYFGDSDQALSFDAEISSAQQSFDRWGSINECSGAVINTFQQGGSYCEQFSACDQNVIVSRCVVHGANQPLGGHIAYRNDDGVPVADMIWSFFEADYLQKQGVE